MSIISEEVSLVNEGKELKKYLAEKEISVDDAVKTIGRLSKNKLYSLLNQEQIPYEYAQLFHYVLGVPMHIFRKENRADLFSPYANNTRVFFVCHPKKDNEYLRNMMSYHEDITQKALDFLEHKTVQNLFIVGYYPLKSYGEKFGDSIALEIFRDCQRRYFEAIQSRILNKKIKYSRCEQLVLPKEKKIVGRTKLAKYCIESISDETFEHIHWCMQNLKENFEFYVVSQGYRPYTFWIADDKSMITEYHRYNRHGAMVPDIHLAFSGSDVNQKKDKNPYSGIHSYIECHQSHIGHIKKHKERFLIRRQDFLSAIMELENGLQIEEQEATNKEELWLENMKSIIEFAESRNITVEERNKLGLDKSKLEVAKRLWDVKSKKDDNQEYYQKRQVVISERIEKIKKVLFLI